MRQLAEGSAVRVTVPATSANLGPGFDSVGIAVDLWDEVEVRVTRGGLSVEIEGEGADDLPRDASHLVVRCIVDGLAQTGMHALGLAVRCRNSIPQSRGLGSSAAAAVAGFAAAQCLSKQDVSKQHESAPGASVRGDDESSAALDLDLLVQQASAVEGHPDNAAAAALGQSVVSFTRAARTEDSSYHAVRLPVDKRIRAIAIIPPSHASTSVVRKVLPDTIPHVDARFNISRAALLPVALQSHPELLFDATEDLLHQPYRAEALPVSHKWIWALRDRKYGAFLSGAGPTVMALGGKPLAEDLRAQAQDEGLKVLDLAVTDGVKVTSIA